MAEGYGKRPLWQWIVIYLIIGGIIYAAIYYFILAKKGVYNYSNPYVAPTSAPSQSSPTTPSQQNPPQQNPPTTKYKY